MKDVLVLDVDGVFTDGTKIYDNSGYAVMKRFCDHDFTAVKLFQRDKWFVIMMSADALVNQNIANNRDIPFWHSRSQDGSIDKVAQMEAMLTKYGILLNDDTRLVYVGDDLFDIPPMEYAIRHAGWAHCPANAAEPVRNFVEQHGSVLRTRGGEGVIMELYTIYGTDFTPPTH